MCSSIVLEIGPTAAASSKMLRSSAPALASISIHLVPLKIWLTCATILCMILLWCASLIAIILKLTLTILRSLASVLWYKPSKLSVSTLTIRRSAASTLTWGIVVVIVRIFVRSAIVATPFRRCEFTKSNVFSNSCTLLVIFLSLSSSLWHNCSCMAFCNSLNLSSSTPSNSGGSGRPLNMNSNIPISFMPILSFCLFLLPCLYLVWYQLPDHLVVCLVCLFQHLRPQFPFCGTF